MNSNVGYVYDKRLYNFIQTIYCFVSDFYNVSNSQGKVARFCLFKQAYRIGDDIVGMCDFSEGTIPCVQVRFNGC